MFVVDIKHTLCYNTFIRTKGGVNIRTVIKAFDELTADELYEILRVRSEVFVVEQSCIYQDLDGIDRDALHVYTEDVDGISAYLRLFMKNSAEGTAQIGRVLTVKRGCGLGLSIMLEGIKAARERLGARHIYIEAQVYAIGFYEKCGFRTASEEFLEDGIPHVVMMLDPD